jgi:hypothetical protein
MSKELPEDSKTESTFSFIAANFSKCGRCLKLHHQSNMNYDVTCVDGYHLSGGIKFYYHRVDLCDDCRPLQRKEDTEYKKQVYKEVKNPENGIFF